MLGAGDFGGPYVSKLLVPQSGVGQDGSASSAPMQLLNHSFLENAMVFRKDPGSWETPWKGLGHRMLPGGSGAVGAVFPHYPGSLCYFTSTRSRGCFMSGCPSLL